MRPQPGDVGPQSEEAGSQSQEAGPQSQGTAPGPGRGDRRGRLLPPLCPLPYPSDGPAAAVEAVTRWFTAA